MGIFILLGIGALTYLVASVVILAERERGVIVDRGTMRLDPVGPGVILVFRPFQRLVKVAVDSQALEVPVERAPGQEPLAVRVRFHVVDPYRAVTVSRDYVHSIADKVVALISAADWQSDHGSVSRRIHGTLSTELPFLGVTLDGVEIGKPA